MVVDIRDLITCFKFGDDRFRGLASAEGQILPFPIDFDGRPYDTPYTLPCERVIHSYVCRRFIIFSTSLHVYTNIGSCITFNGSCRVILLSKFF